MSCLFDQKDTVTADYANRRMGRRNPEFGPHPKKLNLVITVTPSDNAFTIAELCRDAVELCRRLNVEAVKFRHGKVTYYAHKDHVVRKVRANSWDVLREPYAD